MTSLPEILYKGSVKDVRGVRGEAPYVFEFSDRYSIFDWGEMPDQIDGKGAALAFMGWCVFDYMSKPETWKNWTPPKGFARADMLKSLKSHGLQHHMRALVSHDLQPLSYERALLAPSRCMAVEPIDVIRPLSEDKNGKLAWNYSAYQEKPANALIPLEVVFRFSVPEGSSLIARADDPAYCSTIGLGEPPRKGDVFQVPIIEFSTKLETTDHYVTYDAAQKMAGLNDAEFQVLKDLCSLLALRLKDSFSAIDVDLCDGKFEFAFTEPDKNGNRGFMLVDSVGPDELRLTYDGVQLSKEILRRFYRPTSWYSSVEEAKTLAQERGEKDWKRICVEELHGVPPMLAPGVKHKVEMMYKGIIRALSESMYGAPVFPDAWSLDRVAESFMSKDGG